MPILSNVLIDWQISALSVCAPPVASVAALYRPVASRSWSEAILRANLRRVGPGAVRAAARVVELDHVRPLQQAPFAARFESPEWFLVTVTTGVLARVESMANPSSVVSLATA